MMGHFTNCENITVVVISSYHTNYINLAILITAR